jgi:hypothetical protein
MFENWWSWLFPSSSGAIKNGIGAGETASTVSQGLKEFFEKIKKFLNTVLFGRLYPPVAVENPENPFLPKFIIKDTRIFVWHLLLVLLFVFLFRLAFGRVSFFSSK